MRIKGVDLIRLWQQIIKCIILIAGLSLAPSAYAGVGMLAGGESLYNSDLSFAGGNAIWDASRNKILSVCKRRNANLVQGYEYGYSYFYTVYANVTFAYRKCGQIYRSMRINRVTGKIRPATTKFGGQASGIGDIQIGVRARLNHANTAAWEGALIIPGGYDGNSPATLGRGALGLSLGLKFASDAGLSKRSSWAWKMGTKLTYFFASKGNSITSFGQLSYAFTETNFEQTGNFMSLRINNSFAMANNGLQKTLFYNQIPSSLTNSDSTSLSLGYSHAFVNSGWSTNVRVGKAFFGRSSPVDYTAGWGFSYRWMD
ncbi:hypothetical protein [Mariprofundus sp. EBB-1]|uniref:hypothetical protein n=1 Tax=Mariprofundus sp. EBB-1 TaxID=2650971 RepID=UPI001F2199A1|nr:hypothetical protein [Mariprofundus sp. EBB-1]